MRHSHKLLLVVQIQLSDANEELSQLFQHLKWTIRGRTVRTAVPGQIYSNEDIVSKQLMGLEDVMPEKKRVRKAWQTR